MRRLLSLVLAALLALSIVGAVAEDNDEIVITYGKNFDYDGKTFIHDQTLENNYYTQYVKEKHNVRVEYAWVLDDDSQKDALAVVSGEMPDVMYVNQSVFDMLIEADMLQPITKAFAENANQYLREACESYPEAYAAATVKGELMAIPCATVKKQHQVVWVRQDWLDKLGLELPTTLDDIVNIAKAFIEQDPDGNGEKDTIGLPLDSTYIMGNFGRDFGADPIANYMGSYARQWYLDDNGEVVYGSLTPETRNALEYLAQLYADGVIDPQFAVREEKEAVISGKCGIFFGSWCTGPLRQSYGYDGADWVPVAAPLDENGYFYTTNPIPASSYLVVSKKCEHPEAVIWALGDSYEFHRFLSGDPEWDAKIAEYQTAGVSWTIMPFEIQLENEDIVAVRGRDMKQMVETGDRTGVSAQNQSFYDAYLAWLDDNTSLTGWVRYKGMYLCCNVANYEKNVYKDHCFWGMTPTMSESWATLTSLEDEVFMKIVLGEVGIEAFDEFVEQWNAQGGEKITEEVQAWVDARS